MDKPRVGIRDGVVTYSATGSTPSLKSFSLDLNEVEVVGGVNAMIWDDDSDLLVLVSQGKQHVINMSIPIDGYDDFARELQSRFNVSFRSALLEDYIRDKALVLFPLELRGKPLYRFNLLNWFTRFFGISMPGVGVLSKEVIEYLKSLEKDMS